MRLAELAERLGREVAGDGSLAGVASLGELVSGDLAFVRSPQFAAQLSATKAGAADDVEIGAHSAVDHTAFGGTRLHRGAKLDNEMMGGHGSDTGEDAPVGAQAELAGSVRLERGAIVMLQAGVVDHVTSGAGATVGPRSGVVSDVPAAARVLGTPHDAWARQLRTWLALRRWPQSLRRVRALERRAERAVE